MTIAGLRYETQRAPERFASRTRIHGHWTTEGARMGEQLCGYSASDTGSTERAPDIETSHAERARL